jgi:hypothetical protein
MYWERVPITWYTVTAPNSMGIYKVYSSCLVVLTSSPLALLFLFSVHSSHQSKTIYNFMFQINLKFERSFSILVSCQGRVKCNTAYVWSKGRVMIRYSICPCQNNWDSGRYVYLRARTEVYYSMMYVLAVMKSVHKYCWKQIVCDYKQKKQGLFYNFVGLLASEPWLI